MNEQELEQLKYPIGRFKNPENFTPEFLEKLHSIIENFPENLRREVINLTDNQLDTPYRENGWTVRQVASLCRQSYQQYFAFQIGFNRGKPTIKPYFEDRFAELSDSKNFPIEASLQILDGTHKRWTAILKSLSEKDLQKRLFILNTTKNLLYKPILQSTLGIAIIIWRILLRLKKE
jgi:hypothetical protein